MTASSTTSVPKAAASGQAPALLAVLVVHDAADALREVLAALAAQTYARLGILAVDDASSDDSHELLVQALGEGRVIRNAHYLGVARSFAEVMRLPVAADADHLLLLRDDATLDADAVARLVEATRLPNVEGVGIVGAKVVDHDHPRVLLDIGRSSDRFGHLFSALQPGEIDQGQFDRVLEVLCVSSAAMLVARDVWQRIGLFDERLGDENGDLDLCWRARIAGFRVLMTPLARVRRRRYDGGEVSALGRARRLDEDRAALAVVLKSYGLISLLWVVPIGLALTLIRLVYLTLSRRFEEAIDVVSAIGWNIVHLPGTMRRRWRAQRARRSRDRVLHRFMASAGLRLPRWFQTAERIWEEQRELDEEDADQPAGRRLGHRTASLVTEHPVIVASFLAILIGGVAVRGLLGPEPLAGGVLPAFPSSPAGFLAELLAAFRTTGLGGTLAASPALAALAGLSWLTFASTALAQKALLIGLPVLGAILAYRAAMRVTGRPGPSVVAAAAYGVSGLTLWAFSDGRLDLLVGVAALPPLLERLEVAFGPEEPSDGRRRLMIGWSVTVAVAAAFWPGVLLVMGVALIIQTLFGVRRARGLALALGAVVGACILLFPFVPTLLAGGGAVLGSHVGVADPWQVARLALGPGPGTWAVAWFLPLAALLGLALAGSTYRGPALRAGVAAVTGVGLAWASAAGWLPRPLANAPAYTAMAAAAMSMLVAIGLSSVAGGLSRESFGFRQIGTALLVVVLTTGIALQAIASLVGERAVGGTERIPAAWAVIDGDATGAFRVLWVGADDGLAFPPPGGDPTAVAFAGDATLRYALTDRDGVSALDVARSPAGSGPAHLQQAIQQILAGGTVNGGALLAPFGVRFIVANQDELSPEAADRFVTQTDLVGLQASGLVIFRNASAWPPASIIRADERTTSLVASDDPATIQELVRVPATTMAQVEGGWDGPANAGNLAVVSTETDPGWRLEGSEAQPQTAFGWALSFPVHDDPVRIRYGAQLPRTIQIWLLGALWAAALWMTRRPVAR